MQTNPIAEAAPAKKSLFRRIFRLKILLFIFVCLVTAEALFHAEENYRGKRAWESYQRELVVKGEKFDPSLYVPAKVADEENFAMTPFFAPLFDFFPGTQKQRDTNAVQKIYDFGKLPDHSNNNDIPWQVGKATDLSEWVKGWQRMLAKNKSANPVLPANLDLTDRRQAAQAILTLLKEDEAVIEEFRTASRRPYGRFNITYETPDKFSILLPHLAVLRRTCQILQLRASAELALGQKEEAAKDVYLIFHLADTVKCEPILISHLVRIVMLNLGLQPIWEGLAEHGWSEAQLQQFEKQIQSNDMVKDYVMSIRGERDYLGGSFFDEFRTTRSRLGLMNRLSDAGGPKFGASPNWFLDAAVRVAFPTGWSYFEQINCHRLITLQQLKAIDVDARKINPTAMTANWKEVDQFLQGGIIDTFVHHKVMAHMLTPSLNNITKKTAVSQTSLEMGAAACALERFYLAQQQYPANLEALVPKFVARLPHDVISGQALKYRVTDDGRFVLYSVGWNETDDGGTVAVEGKKKKTTPGQDQVLDQVARTSKPDIMEGDWVWKYGEAGSNQ